MPKSHGPAPISFSARNTRSAIAMPTAPERGDDHGQRGSSSGSLARSDGTRPTDDVLRRFTRAGRCRADRAYRISRKPRPARSRAEHSPFPCLTAAIRAAAPAPRAPRTLWQHSQIAISRVRAARALHLPARSRLHQYGTPAQRWNRLANVRSVSACRHQLVQPTGIAVVAMPRTITRAARDEMCFSIRAQRLRGCRSSTASPKRGERRDRPRRGLSPAARWADRRRGRGWCLRARHGDAAGNVQCCSRRWHYVGPRRRRHRRGCWFSHSAARPLSPATRQGRRSGRALAAVVNATIFPIATAPSFLERDRAAAGLALTTAVNELANQPCSPGSDASGAMSRALKLVSAPQTGWIARLPLLLPPAAISPYRLGKWLRSPSQLQLRVRVLVPRETTPRDGRRRRGYSRRVRSSRWRGVGYSSPRSCGNLCEPTRAGAIAGCAACVPGIILRFRSRWLPHFSSCSPATFLCGQAFTRWPCDLARGRTAVLQLCHRPPLS